MTSIADVTDAGQKLYEMLLPTLQTYADRSAQFEIELRTKVDETTFLQLYDKAAKLVKAENFAADSSYDNHWVAIVDAVRSLFCGCCGSTYESSHTKTAIAAPLDLLITPENRRIRLAVSREKDSAQVATKLGATVVHWRHKQRCSLVIRSLAPDWRLDFTRVHTPVDPQQPLAKNFSYEIELELLPISATAAGSDPKFSAQSPPPRRNEENLAKQAFALCCMLGLVMPGSLNASDYWTPAVQRQRERIKRAGVSFGEGVLTVASEMS